MDFFSTLFDGQYGWLWGSLFIFTARVCDVSIGTVRIILVSKGHSILAPLFGFIEVLVWIIAVGNVINNLNNIYYCLAFAAGFAIGNYIGIIIENKIAIGSVIIRIITRKDAHDLIDYLRSKKYTVTTVDAYGKEGPVSLIFMVIKRRQVDKVIEIVNEYNPKAFYSIEDIRSVANDQPPTVLTPALPK